MKYLRKANLWLRIAIVLIGERTIANNAIWVTTAILLGAAAWLRITVPEVGFGNLPRIFAQLDRVQLYLVVVVVLQSLRPWIIADPRRALVTTAMLVPHALHITLHAIGLHGHSEAIFLQASFLLDAAIASFTGYWLYAKEIWKDLLAGHLKTPND